MTLYFKLMQIDDYYKNLRKKKKKILKHKRRH